jgi:hypothetical protein
MTMSGFETPIAAPTKQNEIKMCGSKAFGTRCFKGQGNPRGNTLLSDQRGAVAFETIIVYLFLVTFLLMPLADVAVAGLRYLSAWQALRAFGQYIQYNNPPDPANPGTWTSGLQKTVSGYTIGNIQVMCGNAVCSSGNLTSTPKYFTFSTTVTLAPILLTSVLCPSSCTYTLPYSERFQ